MKKRILILVSLLVVLFTNYTAYSQCVEKEKGCSSKCSHHVLKTNQMQSSSITFKVSGNCEMCKTRIEKAASGVKGVKSAYWDIQTKLLRVDFDKEVKTEEIHKAVAKAGHDTDKIKADNKTYKSLPECCKYRS